MKKNALKLILMTAVFTLSLFMTISAGATEFLSDEAAQKFVDLFYDAGSDSANSAVDVLTGKKEGTIEEVKEIYKNSVTVFNIVNQEDLFSGTTEDILKNVGTLTRVASGALDVYENIESFNEAENSMQKTIDGFQVVEGFLKTINKSDLVPSNISFAIKCIEIGLEIGGILEKAYLAENLSFYECDLMIAYYTGQELPFRSAPQILIGSQITQEEADALYAVKYLEYSMKGLSWKNSSGDNDSGGDAGTDTVNKEETIVDNTVTASTSLSFNTYIGGDLNVKYSLDLNGKVLTVCGDLTLSSSLVVGSGTLYVTGNLIQNGGTFNIGGGEAVICGDYLAKSGTLYHTAGRLEIDGSFLSEKNGTNVYSSHSFQMAGDDAYMLVGGNFYIDSSNGSNNGNYLTAGTLEIKGNFTQKSTFEIKSGNTAPYNFRATGTHKVVLSGNGEQVVCFEDTGSFFQNFEPRNQSGKIKFSSPVVFKQLDSDLYYSGILSLGNCTPVLNCSRIKGGGLTLSNSTINITDGITLELDGDIVSTGNIYQSGGSISIGGSLTQNSSYVDLSGGSFTIEGDYLAKGGTLYHTAGRLEICGNFLSEKNGTNVYSSHSFQMAGDDAYMLVGGNFYIDTSNGSNNGNYLTAGTLEIKGNFTQKSTFEIKSGNTAPYNFRATGTHKVVLSGNGEQVVYFEDTGSFFQNFEPRNQSGKIKFSSPVVFKHLDSDLYYSGILTLGNCAPVLNCSRIKGGGLTLSNSTLNITGGMSLELDGDFVSTGNIYQSGGSISIGGSLTQNSSYVDLSGGSFTIGGDYLAKSGTLYHTAGRLEIDGSFLSEKNGTNVYSSHSFQMAGDDAYMLVCGNFYIDSSNGSNDGNYLTAGTLEIKGNFTQKSTFEIKSGNTAPYNFRATGTHKVIFSGSGVQVIVFEDATSCFNEVVYVNSNIKTLTLNEYNSWLVYDIDGDYAVNLKDALTVCKVCINKTYNSKADFNSDGKITLIDAIRVLKKTTF